MGIGKARAAPGVLCELEQVSPEHTLSLSLPEPGIGIMALLPCRNQMGSVKGYTPALSAMVCTAAPGQVWRCASFPPEPESAELPSTTPWHSTYCLPSCILTPFCPLVWLPACLGLSHSAHGIGGTDISWVLVFLTPFHFILIEACEPRSVSLPVFTLSAHSPSVCLIPQARRLGATLLSPFPLPAPTS